jgi:dinuclear metal center YbgI/SA1388 family protein
MKGTVAMAVSVTELTEYLNDLLDLKTFPGDHSNNGLQVEACAKVKKAVFGVDASLELFEKAAEKKADFVFVHHGISWGSEPKRLDGLVGKRLSVLFRNQISFYAAHLPLDAHPKLGHNARLADMIGLKKRKMFCVFDGNPIGVSGSLPSPQSVAALAKAFEKKLDCKAVIFNNAKKVCTAGIISGGGGLDGVLSAYAEKLDCLITGEIGHSCCHHIKETGMPVITLGHYCSEKPGVLAVMEKIKNKFGADCEFIDIPTGM